MLMLAWLPGRLMFFCVSFFHHSGRLQKSGEEEEEEEDGASERAGKNAHTRKTKTWDERVEEEKKKKMVEKKNATAMRVGESFRGCT